MAEKEIMVVSREVIFKDGTFQGFKPDGDYESIILSNYQWMLRSLAEQNPKFKQPTAYMLITNLGLGLIFAYQRAKKDKDYGEKRLQGKWSLGVGGHIDRIDETPNPIQSSLSRELQEEIEMNGRILNTRVLGYINYDYDEVSKVHFGILYLIETDSTQVKPKDPEMAQGRLRTYSELEKIIENPEFTVEEWSRIALKPLARIFSP